MARDKERRKRRGAPLLVPGFCLPKALQPVLPIYLQGVLQVGGGMARLACLPGQPGGHPAPGWARAAAPPGPP